jgi:hypothetical protein
MPKKKVLKTDEEINRTYEIVKGFNIPDGDGEKRFEPTKKGSFVNPDDFEPDVWDKLVKLEAVKLVDDPTQPGEDETTSLEVK